MTVYSAGILPYRIKDGKVEVMLSHAGGPFWAKKDNAAWSIPKGLLEEGEDNRVAARREFEEETGIKIETELVELGSNQTGQKMITIFATNKDIDVNLVTSNTFEMEWPPKSGVMQTFPENDRAEWFEIEEAKVKIFKGQVIFLTRLAELLSNI